MMDAVDRAILNRVQDGIAVRERPFEEIAGALGLAEEIVVARLERMLDSGVLSRFGPLYNVEAMGGAYTLVAMRVPESDLERVASIINGFPEVAHNYRREHEFNIWFVLAAGSGRRVEEVLAAIESRTGYAAYNMPKLNEYFIGARFAA